MNQNFPSLPSITVIQISSAYIIFFHGLDMYRYFKMIICIYPEKFLTFLSLITLCNYFLLISLLSEEKYCNVMKTLEIINVKNLKPLLSLKQWCGECNGECCGEIAITLFLYLCRFWIIWTPWLHPPDLKILANNCYFYNKLTLNFLHQ